ncbi:hypothetical protein [Treponema zioleckii]|nr:hypothetical protein [Treponema zioleckii]
MDIVDGKIRKGKRLFLFIIAILGLMVVCLNSLQMFITAEISKKKN